MMDESNHDPAAWQRIKDALDQALERPPGERRKCLEELCDDPAVLDQALSVLDAFESAAEPSSAERPAKSSTATSDGQVASGLRTFGRGSEVGPYRIDRKIGAGGMGAVYLAHRADHSFDKKVAIKLIQQKWTISEERISRFRRERQILANLTHPSIAQLLDGGSTAEGFPYLVMEYVEGETIDAYRESRDLSVDEVLDLFQQICSAVQFAHQNLIVHRDLKPANILVDADGQVKLLDFGIAKILDTEDFAVTVLETRPGSSPMTLAYASPEQVSGGAITTATDVYALGILLFQLLTGQRPHPFDNKNLPAAVDAICNQEVTKPSEILRRSRSEPDGSGSHSATWRKIQGDLDAIVRKALEKDPSRRYRSAEQLADDLDRFRSSLPVQARRGTRLYRAQKFFSRNRVSLSAAAIVFTVLVTSVLLLLQQQGLLIDQRNRAEAVADWMVSLFELSDPGQALGQEITVREVLDHSSKTIRDDLADDPRLLHQMLTVLGQTYFNIGLSDEARHLIEDALGTAEKSGTAEHRVDSLVLLSRIAYRQGLSEKAEAYASEAVALTRAELPISDPRLIQALIAEGLPVGASGRYSEALALYGEAEELAIAAGDDATLAEILDYTSDVFWSLGQWSRSQALLRRCLEIRRQMLPDRHPDLLGSEIELMAMLTRTPDEMEPLRAKLREYREVIEGDSERLTATLRWVAEAAVRAELLEESRELYEEVSRIGMEAWGGEHHRVQFARCEIARILRAQGDLDQAEDLYRKALRIARRTLGETNIQTALIINQLAVIELERKDLVQAEKFLLQARQIAEQLEENHRTFVIVLANLGSIQIRNGDLETARGFFQQAVSKARQLEEGDRELSASLYNLADAENRLGNRDQALAYFLEVWEVERDRSSVAPRAMCQAASVELVRGNLSIAERYIDTCRKAWEQWPGNASMKTMPDYLEGLLLIEKKQFQLARPILEEVLRRRREVSSDTFIERAEAALARAITAEG